MAAHKNVHGNFFSDRTHPMRQTMFLPRQRERRLVKPTYRSNDSSLKRFVSDNFDFQSTNVYNRDGYLNALRQELGGRVDFGTTNRLFAKTLPKLEATATRAIFDCKNRESFQIRAARQKSKYGAAERWKKSVKSSLWSPRLADLVNPTNKTPDVIKLPWTESSNKEKVNIEVTSKVSEEDCKNDTKESHLADEQPVANMFNPEMSSGEVLYDIEHDWMLDYDYDKRLQRVRQAKRDLQFPVRDHRSTDAIETRVSELKRMVKPNVEVQRFLECTPPQIRQLIYAIDQMELEDVKAVRRKSWTKPIDTFRGAVLLCVHILSIAKNRKRYCDVTNDVVLPAIHDTSARREYGPRPHRSTLRHDTVEALNTPPRRRTEDHIHKIVLVLRATKAFDHLFPVWLHHNIAAAVAYDRYDDRRVIANQSTPPDRFYYVLNGKLLFVREHHLDAGTVTKQTGQLTKGMTTDREEMERQWLREFTLVAKGQVEVLSINKADFMYLLSKISAPPLSFLRSVRLFSEFPVEMLDIAKDAIECKYYGYNEVILADARTTPWIYVVKSGEVKVVRVQEILDTNHSQDTLPSSVKELQVERPFSHADAMLGCLAYQRKMKTLSLETSPVTSRPLLTGDLPEQATCAGTTGVPPVLLREPTQQRLVVPPIKIQRISTSLPPINIPMASSHERHITTPSIRNQIAFLTRERTEKTFVEGTSKQTTNEKKAGTRQACLQLDVLKSGDVFGVDALVGEIRRKQGLPSRLNPDEDTSHYRELSLVSGGAEVIKVGKRFFLQNAANNTMLKIETMQREYISKEDARTQLREAEIWGFYKALVLERTLTSLDARRIRNVDNNKSI